MVRSVADEDSGHTHIPHVSPWPVRYYPEARSTPSQENTGEEYEIDILFEAAAWSSGVRRKVTTHPGVHARLSREPMACDKGLQEDETRCGRSFLNHSLDNSGRQSTL